MNKIKIGTRGSELALWQAHFVQDSLKELGHDSELIIIKTTGDNIQHIGFDKMEGKGFFTKEIEEALLQKTIDLAVHSHKDLETNNPAGLKIAAVSYRENPADILLIKKEAYALGKTFSLKENAVVGTSSARRKAQLLSFREDISIKDLRGNVPTRIKKLEEENYDAIMLAAAGIKRLNIDISSYRVEELDPRVFIPAPAQGVLGIQIREEDQFLSEILQKINNRGVQQNIHIERGVLNQFQGGCQMPLGVYVSKCKDEYHLWASVAEAWNKPTSRCYLVGTNPDKLVTDTLEKLKRKKTGKVFITRKLKKTAYFKRTLENNGFEVFGEALTKFEPVDMGEIPITDWVFFSSKNCVEQFFAQKPSIYSHTKFGVVGGATEKILKKQGFIAQFVGKSVDTEMIGKEFAKLVGNESVLFPQSSSSYRTIQKQFTNQSNIHEVVAYHSLENEHAQIEPCNIAVMTSPSNVILYFRKGGKKEGVTFVAMGNSTAKKLEEFRIKNPILPWDSSVVALTDAVLSC
jgi:hydroxymethylbilane synthase